MKLNMINKIIYLLTFALTIFGFQSCSTDFDVIGEYEETTVVFGLMDQSEDLHIIKVNKSFLGPGDAANYAMIRDSSEYANVDGVVEEWLGGIKTREWIIKDTVLTDREDGAFFGPEYTAYYFIEPALNSAAEYRLILDINEGAKEVTGSTALIGNITFQTQTTNANVIGFYNGTNFSDFPIKFVNSLNGKRFDVTMRLNWIEITATDTTLKYLDWFIGSETVIDSYLSQPGIYDMQKDAGGNSFYQFMANKLNPDPNVIKRIFKGINIMVASASQDMYTYMLVNAPSDGLIQERPQFTNINNGIGIFAAKYNRVLPRKPISKNSLQYLCKGPVTGDLGFCSDTIIYAAEDFYCQ
jgi:hypothetical protein